MVEPGEKRGRGGGNQRKERRERENCNGGNRE